MTNKEIIEHFYNGLAQKNTAWQEHLANSVVFSDASGKLHAEGKEAFTKSFTSFLRAVKKVTMKQLIIEGDYACAVVEYDYLSPEGRGLHQADAEVWKLENGEITQLTIYFDITEFRTFMGR